jgi:hypothetical protein
MAVTVGFEPKEVRSSSFLLDRKARIHAASTLVESALHPSGSLSILFICGQSVGTDADTHEVAIVSDRSRGADFVVRAR